MNAMRNRALAILLGCALIFLSACTGGGGGGAGGGGTSVSSTGPIIGFGSIIVNGIEFTRKSGLADNRVKLPFDNISGASEKQLKLGMVVRITGTVNSAIGKGEYTSIVYQPDLRGRADSVNQAAGSFTVMGRTVQVETGSQFDGVRDLADLAAHLGAGEHPELELSGNLDSNGVLHATRIGLLAANFADSSPVSIKGTIAAPGAGGFTLGGVNVNTAGASYVGMSAADIAAGLPVAVKGTLDTASNTISHATIEKMAAVAGNAQDTVVVKGIAAGVVAGGTFPLNGPNGAVTVKTASASFSKNGSAADPTMVAAGVSLQVTGSLDSGGAIVATRVSIETEKAAQLQGSLGSKDTANGTLSLDGVKVTMQPATRFTDSSSARLSSMTLADLSPGDYLRVTATVDSAGAVVASLVERFDLPVRRTFVQGPVSATTASALTVLGMTVTVGGGTTFRNADSTLFAGGPTAFLSALTAQVSTVKADGQFVGPNTLDATAGEVQLGQ